RSDSSSISRSRRPSAPRNSSSAARRRSLRYERPTDAAAASAQTTRPPTETARLEVGRKANAAQAPAAAAPMTAAIATRARRGTRVNAASASEVAAAQAPKAKTIWNPCSSVISLNMQQKERNPEENRGRGEGLQAAFGGADERLRVDGLAP